MCGAKHAIAVDNGTAGLHLAMLAAGIGQSPDDEVILPSIGAPGAANMTLTVGARPTFADIISPLEPTLDPDEVSLLIAHNTRAVVVTQYGGYPAKLDGFEDLCRTHNLVLIETSDYGPGIAGKELPARTLGPVDHIGCYSLETNAHSLWGGGGIVVTNDDELASRMRSVLWRCSTTLSNKGDTGRIGIAEVMACGFSYQMNDLTAAINLAQLKTMPEAVAVRQRRAQAYANVVGAFCDGAIQYVFGSAPQAGSAHVAAILVDPTLRNDLRAFLTEKRVETRLNSPPIHTLGAYTDCLTGDLARSTTFAEQVILLPIHADLPMMAPEHIIRFCMMYIERSETALPAAAHHDLKVA